MITTKDFPALTDDLESIFDEIAAQKLAEMKGDQIFEYTETERQTHTHQVIHGAAGIQELTEGQDFPDIPTEEGDQISYTQRQFGGLIKITKIMRKFDLYDKIEGRARSVITEGFDKIDQSHADVFLYGWATSYTDVYSGAVSAVGPDGLQLFSTAHTNPLNSNQFSNVITSNPILSLDAVLTAREQGLVFVDVNGLAKPLHLDTLIVAPANEALAERILYSDQMPGNANNDINPIKGKIKKLIVWERLQTRSDGTDTSAYYFMVDSRYIGETLKTKWSEVPSLDPPEQVYRNKNWEYTMDYLYAWGIGYPAYAFGSNASGS